MLTCPIRKKGSQPLIVPHATSDSVPFKADIELGSGIQETQPDLFPVLEKGDLVACG